MDNVDDWIVNAIEDISLVAKKMCLPLTVEMLRDASTSALLELSQNINDGNNEFQFDEANRENIVYLNPKET